MSNGFLSINTGFEENIWGNMLTARRNAPKLEPNPSCVNTKHQNTLLQHRLVEFMESSLQVAQTITLSQPCLTVVTMSF